MPLQSSLKSSTCLSSPVPFALFSREAKKQRSDPIKGWSVFLVPSVCLFLLLCWVIPTCLIAPKGFWSYDDGRVNATEHRANPSLTFSVHQENCQPGSDFSIFIAQEAVRSKKKPAWFLSSRSKKRKHLLTCKLNKFGCGRHREGVHNVLGRVPSQKRTPFTNGWAGAGLPQMETQAPILSVKPFRKKVHNQAEQTGPLCIFTPFVLPPVSCKPFLRTECRLSVRG